MDNAETIETLARRWSDARPAEGTVALSDLCVPVPLPGALQSTVTRNATMRPLVLEDAQYWLAAPRPAAEVTAFVLLNGAAIETKRGLLTLAPALFQVTWLDDGVPVSRELSVSQIVLEDGHWRVAALWSKSERREAGKNRAQLEALRQLKLS